MSKCGVCGGGISLTVVPHAELCEDDRKAERVLGSPEFDDLATQLQGRRVLPEIDDIIKQLEEEEGED